jgi:tetratricopeptide (TPR) repeat protein
MPGRLHDTPPPTVVAELALHFERGQDWVRAVRYLAQAAEHSARRFANREALAYLSRALALVNRLPPAEQEGTRVGLLQQRAHVHSVMDDLDGATEDLKRVLQSGRERNDQALVVKTLIEISRIARWVDSRHCLEAAAEAEAISRDLDDEFIKVWARVNCARANLFFAEWRQDNVATCRSGFRVVRAARDPSLMFRFYPHVPWMECMSSNYELARLVAEEAARIAQGLGDSLHFMQFRWLELWTLIYLGRLGEVRRGLMHALSVAEKNGNHSWIMNYRLILARVHEEALDFNGARVHCDHALKICRERRAHLFTVHAFILSGQAFLGLQDSARAYEHLSEAARLSEDSMGIADWHMYLPLHQGLAEYWLLQNDLTQAREMASKLCAHAALPPERTYLAFGHRLLAEIAIAERQWEQAEAEVAQAMSAMNGPPTPSAVWHVYGIAPPACSSPCAGWSVPLAAWRVYATAAKLCERQGRQGEADAYRQQSRAVIQQLADSLDGSDPLRTSLLARHERVIRSTAMASISEHVNGSLA